VLELVGDVCGVLPGVFAYVVVDRTSEQPGFLGMPDRCPTIPRLGG
jgi:hypothetical protein